MWRLWQKWEKLPSVLSSLHYVLRQTSGRFYWIAVHCCYISHVCCRLFSSSTMSVCLSEPAPAWFRLDLNSATVNHLWQHGLTWEAPDCIQWKSVCTPLGNACLRAPAQRSIFVPVLLLSQPLCRLSIQPFIATCRIYWCQRHPLSMTSPMERLTCLLQCSSMLLLLVLRNTRCSQGLLF